MRVRVLVLLFVGSMGVRAAASPGPEIDYEILRASDAATRPNENFGWAVDRTAGIVAVGAPAAYESDSDRYSLIGGAYLFDRQGDGWRESKVVPHDAVGGDLVGNSVAILGDRVLVGSYHHDARGPSSGAVWVYHLTESGWVEETELVGSDVAAQDWFGVDIAIHGDEALITAPQHGDEIGA